MTGYAFRLSGEAYQYPEIRVTVERMAEQAGYEPGAGKWHWQESEDEDTPAYWLFVVEEKASDDGKGFVRE